MVEQAEGSDYMCEGYGDIRENSFEGENRLSIYIPSPGA